jgi:ketosteroid isomerase-like protein
VSASDGMTDVERLVELQAIYHLKGRRDHAVDRKDWATYAELHTDDYVAMSISSEPIVGGNAAAQALSVQLANVTTVHHCHTPVIDFEDREHATGVWAMEDNLFWTRNGEKQWLRGYGFYHETYVRGHDDRWRFSYRKLERTHAETSPGASIMAADFSGENLRVGVAK